MGVAVQRRVPRRTEVCLRHDQRCEYRPVPFREVEGCVYRVGDQSGSAGLHTLLDMARLAKPERGSVIRGTWLEFGEATGFRLYAAGKPRLPEARMRMGMETGGPRLRMAWTFVVCKPSRGPSTAFGFRLTSMTG